MEISSKVTEGAFTPREVERMTGLSTAMQRDWRKRGFLSSLQGKHARFTADEVAALFIMKLLADGGLGPAVSHRLAQPAARALLMYGTDTFAALEVEGPAEAVDEYSKAYASDTAEWEIASGMKVEDLQRYLVFVGPDKLFTTNDLNSFAAERRPGPMLILDLDDLGKKLAARAPRPLRKLHVAPGGGCNVKV